MPKLWTPAEITTALWVDASDEDTITLDEYDNVSQWDDKSGNGRNLVQTTVSYRPGYSTDQIINTGIAKSLFRSLSGISDGTVNEYTIFMVVTPDKNSSTIYSQSNTGGQYYSGDAYNNTVFAVSGNTGSAFGPVAPIFSITGNCIAMTETRTDLAPYLVSRPHSIGFNKFCVMFQRKTNGTIKSGLNGVLVDGEVSTVLDISWVSLNTPSAYTSNSYFNGKIHEIILIFDGDINDEFRQLIEGYLAHKWGTTGLLASDHPFKGYPPYVPYTGYFEGYVYEQECPISRKLFLHYRDTGELMDSTTSSGNGYYYLETTYSGSHYIVCLDDEDGESYNDLILSRLYPTEIV